MADQKDEYGKPVPQTWEEAVKDAGGEDAARIKYPTLDPQFKADVKKYGEGKGIEEYSHQEIDPATIPQGEGSWSAAFSPSNPQEGFNEYAQGLGDLAQHGAVGKGLADVGSVLLQGGEDLANVGPALFGGPPVVTDPGNAGAAAGGKTKPPAPKATTPAISPAAQAADSMMQSLATQFGDLTNSLAPYIGGAAGTAASNYATQLGQSIGGPAVQAQNQEYAAALAGPQNEVAKAAGAGAAGIGQALGNLGQADEAFMQTAPYQGLLSALGSEAQYRAETSGQVPVTGTPQWIQDAYNSQLALGAPNATAVGNAGTTANPNSSASNPSTNTTSSPGSAGGSG